VTLVAVALLAAAFAIRLTYVDSVSFKSINDAGTYNRLGSEIAQTGDYNVGNGRHTGAGGSHGPTAYFPPGFPYFLAVVDLITGHQAGHKAAIQPARVGQAVLGAMAVGLLGLVALELFGAGTALVCMALAAVYPVFVELSGTLVAENLLVVLELAATWTILRAARSPRPLGWIAATGILLGLASLTHENAILWLLPLGFAAWQMAGRRGARPRSREVPGQSGRSRARALAAPAVLALFTVAMIAPWTIRNAVVMHHFIPISDETGITLVGTYNPTAAAFRPVPYKWQYFARTPGDAVLAKRSGDYSEVELGAKLQSQALHYIADHPTAPLDAAVHNALRMLELEGTFAWHASALAIGLHVGVAKVGVVGFWVMCALAIAGLFTGAARSVPRWLWAMPLLYALSIVFVNVETPRFREPIDPFLVLLAGCAVSAALERLALASGLRRAPIRRGRRATELPGDEAQLVQMVQGLA
jgi:hypothetical protein